MRIGIVDLDTSHPQNWIPIEKELGHEVTGVWDGGAVHPSDYVDKFAEDHKIARRYDGPEDMAKDVDCAIIHGCDWDTHVDKARPFVEAGRSVLIDKPMAGNAHDLNQIAEWVRQGARITGGSSLRFCREIAEWHAQPKEERGTAHTALCGCAVDEFNYGIHAYSMLSAVLGEGIHSVRHLGDKVQRRIQVNWHDGKMGILVIGQSANWLPFYATIVTEKAATQLQADSATLYRGLLEATLPYLAGETDDPPLPVEVLIEPERAAIAARKSWLHGNREVPLAELTDSADGYDGHAFAVGYKKTRYPETK